nr:dehydrodolichyl diphosphate synthase complex subunit nus1 [Quercus suber]
MPTIDQTVAFRNDTDNQGNALSAADREKLLEPYLPKHTPQHKRDASNGTTGIQFHHTQRVRPALKHILYNLIFTVIHVLFSIYIRYRQLYRAIKDRIFALLCYHHRTPELIRRDMQGLSKMPNHLSVMLDAAQSGGKKSRIDSLVSDACEVVAWTACAGIPMLSIYERSGLLKTSLPHLHRQVSQTLDAYFCIHSPNRPTFSLRAPHIQSYSPPHSPSPIANDTDMTPPHLNILLIDASDGRQTLVDLTKTLAEMAQQEKLSPTDISSELIDAEISESVMGEPDMLIMFGKRVVLDGYPPWQVRLTEIFYMQDNVGGVGYHVFLRGLYKYAKAQMRFGS